MVQLATLAQDLAVAPLCSQLRNRSSPGVSINIELRGQGDIDHVRKVRVGPRTPKHGKFPAASTGPAPPAAQPEMDQARLIARGLAASGKPVSRRALRSGGVRGSNEALNTLARTVSAERAGAAAQPPPLNGASRPPSQPEAQ